MLFFFRQEAQEAAVYVASDVHLHRLDGGHLYHVGGDCNCDHVRSHDCTHRGQSNDLKVGTGYAHIHHHVHIHDTATQGNIGSFILTLIVLRSIYNSRTAIAGAIIGLLLVFYNSKNLHYIGRCLFFKICSHIFMIFEVKLE